jgi:hypothetical protein
MEHSESIGALASALAKAQGEIENAHKTSDNPFFRSKYADLAEIINTARPVLAKHGLSVVQIPGMDGGSVSVETVLLHESGEWLSGVSAAPMSKQYKKDGGELPPSPQAVGSSITYLRRYSLAALCAIAQEDDDGNAASRPRREEAAEPEPDAETGRLAVPATSGQVDLLTRLMQSHVFTKKERADINDMLSRGISKGKAMEAIDHAQKTLADRKAIEKSDQRESA